MPEMDKHMVTKETEKLNYYETATFGGGCFWCIETVFNETKGVIKAVSGYSGGITVNPSYEDVCTGKTGHAEVVQIIFDPDIISYDELLTIFFSIHDPTSLNRQGADIGTQYRSVIFYHDNNQKVKAENMIQKLTKNEIFSSSIVTQVQIFDKFYQAEDYHQGYFKKNPAAGYCNYVIKPKVEKFREIFNYQLK